MLAAGSRVVDEGKNEQVNGKCRRVSRLSKSVETSCVVRSEHRAAKGGMIAGEGNGARRAKEGGSLKKKGTIIQRHRLKNQHAPGGTANQAASTCLSKIGRSNQGAPGTGRSQQMAVHMRPGQCVSGNETAWLSLAYDAFVGVGRMGARSRESACAAQASQIEPGLDGSLLIAWDRRLIVGAPPTSRRFNTGSMPEPRSPTTLNQGLFLDRRRH